MLHPDFLTLPLAHRGLHGPGMPENSMAAFRAAVAQGYGIELDIQPAADGTPLDATVEDTWRRVARDLAQVEANPAEWEDRFKGARR